MSDETRNGPAADAAGPESQPDLTEVQQLLARSMAIAGALGALQQLIGAIDKMVDSLPDADQERIGRPLLDNLRPLVERLQATADEMMPGGLTDAINRATAQGE